MDKRWICSDVWLNILPFFDHAQLGLQMALLSDRFDALVDKHFDGKTELTLWKLVLICKDIGPTPKLSVRIGVNFVEFPFPDRPLPNKIRFQLLHICYIDHSVIRFLRSNKQIWDRSGTKLDLNVHSDETESDVQPILDVLAREIWPIFATSIRHLRLSGAVNLDNLRRLISPTILFDVDQLNSINCSYLYPDGIADDGPNATAEQMLSKWLHTPTKDGQPKRLCCRDYLGPPNLEWVNNFKEAFLRATTSVSYNIQFNLFVTPMPIEQFELVNERTNEKLILRVSKEEDYLWQLKRCPIGETEAVNWEDENSDANLNNVRFELRSGNNGIGPLSPSAEEEKAGQSNENYI